MDSKYLSILVCPNCTGNLEISSIDESIDEQGVAVICSRMIELSNNHLLTKATRGFI